MKAKYIFSILVSLAFVNQLNAQITSGAWSNIKWYAYFDSVYYYVDINDKYNIEYSTQNAYVKEIPVQTSVNEIGAAVINVPLELPNVNNGLKPDLTLHYNSMQTETMFGNEWGLAGLSEISRVDKSVYYNGVIKKVNKHEAIDGTEAFRLNGKPLIITTNNFPNSINYLTETGNIKVKAYISQQDQGYIYSHFEVYYPDGKRAIFGFEDIANNKDQSHFPITSITDQLGNKVLYEYIYSYDEYRINHISFGRNMEASVDFGYKADTIVYKKREVADELITRIICAEGSTVPNVGRQKETPPLFKTKITNSILSSISIKYNNKNVHTYSCTNYANDRGIFLSSIQMLKNKVESPTMTTPPSCKEGVPDPTMPDAKVIMQNDMADFTMPVRFSYTQNPMVESFRTTVNSLTCNYLNRNSKKGIFGSKQTNGIVIYPKVNSFKEEKCPIGENIIVKPDLNKPETYTFKTEEDFLDIFCMDIDGKAGDEIVMISNRISDDITDEFGRVYPPADALYFAVYTINDTGEVQHLYTRTYPTSFDIINDKPCYKEFFCGDFNGDGTNEILTVSALRTTYEKRSQIPFGEIYDLKNDITLYQNLMFDNVTVPDNTPPNQPILIVDEYKTSLLVGDFNGDGKTDLFYKPRVGSLAALIEFDLENKRMKKLGNNFTVFSTRFDINNPDAIRFYTGDFNGDGKADLYAAEGDVYFSDGKQLKSQQIGSEKALFVSTKDMDDNGQNDLTFVNRDAVVTYFFDESEIIARKKHEYNIPEDYVLVADGSVEVGTELVFIGDSIMQFIPDIELSNSQMLTGVKSGLGVASVFGYGKSTYNNISTVGFPYQNNNTNVVNEMRTYVDKTAVDTKKYNYENGVIHGQGRGFCGFQKVMVTDSIRNQTITKNFNPMNFGVLERIDSPTASSKNTYNVNVSADKTASIRLKSSIQTDKLTNVTINKSYIHDSYGNVQSEIVEYGEGIRHIMSNSYNNYNTESYYRLGEPITATIRNLKGTAHTYSRQTFAYNNKGLPINKITEYNGNKVSEETSNYSDKSDLLSIGAKAYTTNSLLTKAFTYDDAGKVIKETDPLGLSIEYEYNAQGQMIKSKDIYGKTTQYEYDNMRQLVKTVSPLGSVSSIKYNWINQEYLSSEAPKPPLSALYSKTTINVDKAGNMLEPETTTYYDALGRELRTEQLRFDGTWMKTDKLYDVLGRLQKVSLPFKGDVPVEWNIHSYDNFDRLTQITYASGKKDTYSYSDNSVTSVIDGIRKTTRYNKKGEVESIEDAAGTITYNYRTDGQISTIVAPGNVTTTFEYDIYGRQTSINDPSAGYEKSEYNSMGNISQHTDANGKKTSYGYDSYGRLIQEVRPEFSTNYTYNAYGALASEISSNGTSRSITYDEYGRVSTEHEYASESVMLKKNNTYSNERITSSTYKLPDNSEISEIFKYTNGYLTEMQQLMVVQHTFPDLGTLSLPGSSRPPIFGNLGISFWQLTEENDMGQPTKAKTGKITRSYAYDEWGHPTRRKIEKTAGGVISDQLYTFSPINGNLTHRSDNVNNTEETFAYDNMNRLTKITAAPYNIVPYNRTINYASNGNIDEISDLGVFEYANSAKPYQMSSVYPNSNIQSTQFGEAHNISYTSFSRLASISQGDYSSTFTYNNRGERVRMHQSHVDRGDLSIRYYLGDRYEKDLNEDVFYLGGDAYTAPAIYKKENNKWNVYYICRDYQGSICAIVDDAGNKIKEYSYDAWGRLRNPQTLEIYTSDTEPQLFTGRGYTGHEHLKTYGLINMNARLYDPVVGRFLSPDPYVQDPTNSQNYNRYSYCLNNPLKYTDPTGEAYRWNDMIGAYQDEKGNVVEESQVWLYECGFKGRSNFTNTTGGSSVGWNIPGYYLPGYYYYNTNTRQLRYLDASGKYQGAWLRTLNLSEDDRYVFEGGYRENDGTMLYNIGTKINTSLGLLGTLGDFSSASFRLTKGSAFSPKLYSSGWTGGGVTKIKTYKFAQVGKVLGRATFLGSTLLDGYGVYTNAISPEQAGLNGICGIIAYFNPYFAAVYGFSELFIPGGSAAVLEAGAEVHKFHNEMNRQYWWYPNYSTITQH